VAGRGGPENKVSPKMAGKILSHADGTKKGHVRAGGEKLLWERQIYLGTGSLRGKEGKRDEISGQGKNGGVGREINGPLQPPRKKRDHQGQDLTMSLPTE